MWSDGFQYNRIIKWFVKNNSYVTADIKTP